MSETLYLCTGSHDWEEFKFFSTDPDEFLDVVHANFDVYNIETVVCDDKFKSIQFLQIDLITGDVSELKTLARTQQLP